MVNKKFATCVAVTEVRPEDKSEAERLSVVFKTSYNDDKTHLIKQGDIVLGNKAQRRIEIQQKAQEKEAMQNA